MSNHPQQARKENPKEKKRKARRDLVALLKRLRKLCGQFESAEDWLEYADKWILPVLDQHQDVLPAAHYQRLQAATRLSEPTRAAANQACRVLQTELKQIIKLIKVVSLPVAAAQVAAGLIIVTAVIAATGALALNALAPEVQISNQDCGPIPLHALSLLNNIPGIDLPTEIPDDGQPHLMQLIPGQIDVDSSQTNELTVRLFGLPVIQSWEIGGLTSIIFTEAGLPREILGRDEHISLSLDSEYEVILTCH